ncbi:hypothetical protein BDF14DRAFT_1857195, partial [Spinellus fusiger]
MGSPLLFFGLFLTCLIHPGGCVFLFISISGSVLSNYMSVQFNVFYYFIILLSVLCSKT